MVFDIILTVLAVLILLSVGVLIYFVRSKKSDVDNREISKAVTESVTGMTKIVSDNLENTNKAFSSSIGEKTGALTTEMKALSEQNASNYRTMSEGMQKYLDSTTKAIREENEKGVKNLNERLEELSKSMKERYEQIEKSVDKALSDLRRENSEKLTSIQQTVDEKLQKTIDERLKSSFESVVTQIGDVNKAIGEIKTIATDVGSLKNVLTNVKTKGVIGEAMLGNIIGEVLTKGQYDVNVKTKKGSNDMVEYAIKMPGKGEGEFIYLPLDAKFPLETYYKIKDAIQASDKDMLDKARVELVNKLKAFAKDISTKYIDPPRTTDFAIMFLPTEGLYIEAIETGVYEEIQRKYNVNIVGPSTIVAFLNALRSGFNSLAIEKKSAEVFKLLEAVKTEFETFATALSNAQKKVESAGDELDKLVGTRTRAMQRKLKEVGNMPLEEARELIDAE